MHGAPATDRAGQTEPILGWACYLGASWTWVIGMLWPILLVRDDGVAGWLAFALPNVAGAAAMGYILPSAAASRRLTRRHGRALALFSDLTLAFHAFAATALFGPGLGPGAVPAVAAAAALAWHLARRGEAPVRGAAILLTLVSLTAFALLWTAPPAPPLAPPPATRAAASPPLALPWLLPSLLFGFLLSPYLDLTFHRARQHLSPAGGRRAFTLGFAGVFLAMILFSLAYAERLTPLFAAGPDGTAEAARLTGAWRWILGAHLVLQAGFTLGLHGHERTRPTASRQTGARRPGVAAALALALGLLLGLAATRLPPAVSGMSRVEAIYRGFLLFYGLLLPGYVWVVMIASGRPRPTRRAVAAWLSASLLAMPLGGLAFIGGRGPWLVPAMLLMAAAGAVAALDRRGGEAARG